MKRYRVSTPAPGYTGTSAEVHFQDGAATVAVRGDDPQNKAARQLAYFREAGYGVVEVDEAGEPIDTTDEPAEPLPADSASEFRWRFYAVRHAGMSVSDVDALGDRADVMRAVRARVGARQAGDDTATATEPGEEPKPPARKRAPRKANTPPAEDASDDELRQYVRAKAIEAGDDDLTRRVDGMSRDELAAQVKEYAK